MSNLKIMTDIIVPSCKCREDVSDMLVKIFETRTTYGMLHFTGQDISAAANRNLGLEVADESIIIMLDDDTGGFTEGWDERLIRPLVEDKNLIGVSARLLHSDGSCAYTMTEDYNLDKPLCYSQKIPTSCFAFRNTHLRYDENYLGSGFEDDDFCRQLLREYGQDKLFATVNACRIIHRNEAKNQRKYWDRNLKYFNQKWGGE